MNEIELNQIFHTAADGMRVIDRNFNVLRMNKALCHMSGISIERGLGKKCYEVFSGSVCHTAQCPFPMILAGRERIECDVFKLRYDGVKIPCILTATPLSDSDGNVIGIVENFKDISERKAMEEALLSLNSELELRVKKRTQDLEEEILQRKKSEKALKISEKKLRRLSSELLDRQERERQHIANELHDVLGRSLTAIKYSVESIVKNMYENGDSIYTKKLNNVLMLIKNAGQEVREISVNLRPSILDDLGILATISWFCREFNKTYPEFYIQRNITVQEDDIPDPIKIVVFRLLQEAMNNSVKHCQCNKIQIDLKKSDNKLSLTIQDNGNGFDLSEQLSSNKGPDKRFGLISMQERVELSGGVFNIKSSDIGTIISVEWL
uniref:histidine kinase n=1 Tax=Candidatus Magnetananas rongchengensis TaxID=1463558 RepID=A0A3S6J6J0_9BACT|nr:Signal transduction histidine kinase [Candidatus Magnetananas rongchenensis]